MKTYFSDKELKYDGSQLHSLYAYLNHKVSGDSIISWVGGCDISLDHMVDGEDVLDGSKIYSEKMLHFIVEVFGASLKEMALYQRLLGEVVMEVMAEYSKGNLFLKRKGDDLYKMKDMTSRWEKGVEPIKDKDLFKLNVSIATVSPVSGLLHFGLNISSQNTPIKTYGLDLFQSETDGDVVVSDFASQIMSLFLKEYEGVKFATQKVKWVK